MGEIISMHERRRSRSEHSGRADRQASIHASSVVIADQIRRQILERPLVHGERDRLSLAENLWEILHSATVRKSGLSIAEILRKAGQGQKEDSTKRLVYFAVDPSLPIEKRLQKAKNLRRHVDRYVHIAMTAAREAGLNADRTLVQLFSRSEYERRAPPQQAEPFDEALADLLVEFERDFESAAGRPVLDTVATYYRKLRQLRVTVNLDGDSDKGWTEPNAHVWRSIWPAQDGAISVPLSVKKSIPFMPIGTSWLAEVDGTIAVRAAAFDPSRITVHVVDGESLAPGAQRELPAKINVCAEVALAIFPFHEDSLPRLVLMVKPTIFVSSIGLTFVGVEKGKEEDDDWEYFGLWHDDPLESHVAATSQSFALFGSSPCNLYSSYGHIAVEEGYIEGFSYALRDGRASLAEFPELHRLNPTDWLILPLTLESMRRWLMADMLDDEYSKVAVATVDWAKLISESRKLLATLKRMNDRRPASEPEEPDEPDEAPPELDLGAGSFPEGTMAAALERGVIAYRGRSNGPLMAMFTMAVIKYSLLILSEQLAARRRKGKSGGG
ncbi:MAG: hypothetical protein LCH95_18165 [Proteobacteria bacterium]|nr:hypothetical protein [Pseudomonadota bacterium]